MKWSEVFIISFLEEYFNNDYNKRFEGRTPFDQGLKDISQNLWIESVLSQLNPYVWVSEWNGGRYYEDNDVKKSLGLLYNDLEKSYTDKGYGELVEL